MLQASLTFAPEIYSKKFRTGDVNVRWIWTGAFLGQLAWYVKRSPLPSFYLWEKFEKPKTAYHYKLKVEWQP